MTSDSEPRDILQIIFSLSERYPYPLNEVFATLHFFCRMSSLLPIENTSNDVLPNFVVHATYIEWTRKFYR